MVVCKYWKTNSCRNGNNCRFEHPRDTGNNSNSNNNRQGGFGSNDGAVFGNLSRPERWYLNEDEIRTDLTGTRPKWILTAYGPGKEPPASLFAETEYSPEEVRWRFYQQQAAGNADAADREAIALWQTADATMQNAAANAKDVQKFMEGKEREHPNRYDFLKMDGKLPRDEFVKNSQLNTLPGSSINPFGGTTRATASTNPFSKPAFGQASSPFGQAAQTVSPFGQPAQPAVSPFGQPAQTSPSPFKPTQTTASSFGQPAQPAFGQTGFGGASTTNSAFGKPAFGQTSFGQTGFNQPKSAFGQPLQGSPVFGTKPSDDNQNASSGFGQTSTPGQSNNPFAKPSAASGFGVGTGLGGSGFGQTATPSTSPFGQLASGSTTQSGFGINTSQTSGFGQTGFSQGQGQQQPSAFNQSRSAFGQTSPLNQQAQQLNNATASFGQQSQPGPAFGQPAPLTTQSGSTSFGQPTNNAFNTGFNNTQNSAQKSPFGNLNDNTSMTGTTPVVTQGVASPFTTGFSNKPAVSFSTGQASPQLQQQQSHVGSAFGLQTDISTTTNTSQATSGKPTNGSIQPLHYTETLPYAPPVSSGRGNELATYRNLPVEYQIKKRPTAQGEEIIDQVLPCYHRPDNNRLERIWFPQGSQDTTVQKLANAISDFQVQDDQYTDTVKQQYAKLFETGKFEVGKVPLVPPMRGWIDYDF